MLDLEAWDRVELQGFGYDSLDDVLARVSQQGGDAVFSDQGVTITFHGIDKAGLGADMFIFG